MSLKCGIVGLPNVGKSTLFNCLSSAKAQAANFPFCTIEPNVGTVTVPDERLTELSNIVNPERIVPAVTEIVDIAGLVKGASRGEGLGNKFLANIRECDAILHVLRCFDNDNIVHVDGNVNPVRDKEIIDTELQIKDLEAVEARMKKVEKMAKTGGDPDAKKLYDVLSIVKEHLEKGKSVRSAPIEPEQRELMRDLFLLTDKPVLYVCNVDESAAKMGNAHVEKVREAVKDENAEIIVLAVALESDIAQLETYDEKMMFLEEVGLTEPGVNRLIKSAFKLLKLQTYFTAGVKEVRAWTITEGMTAPEAAGVIHTDFQRGFIKADVIKYDDFLKYKTEAACRENGKLAIEGKEYIVKDGDIMHFKFNV